jgi:hypothetical protein
VSAAPAGTSGSLLRTLLLAPAGVASADAALETLRASRRDRQLARALLSLPRPRRAPAHRDAVLLLRRSAPFPLEAVTFASTAHGAAGRALAVEAGRLLSVRGALGRVLRPRRPLAAGDVARLLGVSGPALGHALARLDEALATGDVRGRSEARAFLLGMDGTAARERRVPPGTV